MTPPKLEVDFTRQEDSLLVRYTVTNPTRQTIWLLDILWAYSPEGDIGEETRGAYVSVHVDGAVKIGRCLHPLPQEMLVEENLVPFARKVRSMQSCTGEVDLPLPLREYNPYYDDPEQEDELPKDSTSVRFFISWVPELKGMTARDTVLDGARDLDAPNLMPEVRTVGSDPEELTLPVKRRTDQFERF